MSSLQSTPGVTPYPQDAVEQYQRAGLWGQRRIEQIIGDTAVRRADHCAVIDADGTTTYAGLAAGAEHAARLLAGHGIEPGDNLVLQMPNSAQAIMVLLGAFRLGARPVLALNTHRGTEVAGFLAAGRADHWILGDLPGVDLAAFVADVRERLGRPVAVIRWRPGPAAGGTVEAPVPTHRIDATADELAFFQLSGGTTGASKLIPRAHREYAYSFLRSNELCGIDQRSVLVVPLPLTHNFPMSSPGFLGVLAAGGCVVLLPHGDPAGICQAVEAHRATHLIAVPPLVQVLLDAPSRAGRDLSSLQRVIVGGARLSPAVARRVHTEIGALQQVYGMAEGLVCYTDPADDPEVVVTTQGRPMSPHDEVRVVDPDHPGAADGRAPDLGPGRVGELQTRGPYTIRGYYFGGPREQASFTTDGFYRTGDLVRRDESGSIAVVGRTKEQINRGGEKISPAEVEDALLRHPAVHDACVVGEADDLLGERIVAYVVPRREVAAGALDRRVLRRHLLAQSLAAFKIPDGYRVVDQLPTTAVGKVARRRVTADRPPQTGHRPADDPEVDVLGIGFGPANMALAVAIREANQAGGRPLRAAFVDAAPHARWHAGLLFEDASMQVAFVKDLATMRNPRSAFTFTQFLHERGRLADFVNRGSMTPLRIEFVEYLRWAADALRDDVTYGTRAETVTPVLREGRIEGYDVDLVDERGMRRVRARHVVLAAGLQPRLPSAVTAGPRVWHSSEHLHRVADLDPGTARDVVVLGGGQSAAEVVLHLRDLLPQARIHAVLGRFGYTPSDSSPFANQIFDPDSVDLLYDAPASERARIDAVHANTNDAVVAPATLQTLYDHTYRDRWLGRERLIWHRSTQVVGVRGLDHGVEVALTDALTGRSSTIVADALVCATGYQPLDPATLLREHDALLNRDEAGRPLATRDYAAIWKLEARGRLFLVGQTRHQHGVSATLLSNIAVRAGEIVDALTSHPQEPCAGAVADLREADRASRADALVRPA